MRRSGIRTILNLILGTGMLAGVAHADEFVFARLIHEGGGARWQFDWPEAEDHFLVGLQRMTALSVADEGTLLRLNAENLFDHPWLYAVEVGFLSLSNEEVTLLREYLLRGGFLMVDDFHGETEWRQFESEMRRVFPQRRIVELPAQDSIFQTHFDLSVREQIPGIRSLLSGRTWEKGGVNPTWRGILDDHDRVMVAINFNQDIGDGWEHADAGVYPAQLTTQAYKLGINYILYAMTH